MKDTLKQLKDIWFLLALVISLVIWYANTNSRLTAVEAKQIEQSTIIDKITQLSIDIAVVKNDVSYIKAKVREN